MTDKEMDCVLVTAVDNKGFEWGFTLRGDTLEDVFTKIDSIQKKFEKQEFSPRTRTTHFVNKPTPTSPVGANTPTPVETKPCPIHGVPMQGREGKFGFFYSHKTDTGYCNGKQKSY